MDLKRAEQGRSITESSMALTALFIRKLLYKGSQSGEKIDSAHRIRQVCGQILRFGVALGLVERDVTPDLKGALKVIPRTNYAAITEPKELGVLMRAIYGFNGHVVAVAALKLAPLLFVRPGELRAAEWREFDLDAGEWRIPAAKMKMKMEHMVPLARQAVEILRELHRVTGHGDLVISCSPAFVPTMSA